MQADQQSAMPHACACQPGDRTYVLSGMESIAGSTPPRRSGWTVRHSWIRLVEVPVKLLHLELHVVLGPLRARAREGLVGLGLVYRVYTTPTLLY